MIRFHVPSARLAVLALFLPLSAGAHHAFFAEFDGDAPVRLEGRVTTVEWINPHTWIHLEVVGEEGASVPWMVEGGTPNTLMRRGFDKNTLAIGTEILVRGYRAKDKSCKPACKANGRDVTFPDGRKLFFGTTGVGAPRDGSDPLERPR